MYIVFGGDFGVNQVATWYRVCELISCNPLYMACATPLYNYTYNTYITMYIIYEYVPYYWRVSGASTVY